MFHELVSSLNSFALLADCPSTFTLAAIGGGCLLGYEILRRKPAPVATYTDLSLNGTAAPASELAPMPVSFIMQNARVPELTTEAISVIEVGHNASAA